MVFANILYFDMRQTTCVVITCDKFTFKTVIILAAILLWRVVNTVHLESIFYILFNGMLQIYSITRDITGTVCRTLPLLYLILAGGKIHLESVFHFRFNKQKYIAIR